MLGRVLLNFVLFIGVVALRSVSLCKREEPGVFLLLNA